MKPSTTKLSNGKVGPAPNFGKSRQLEVDAGYQNIFECDWLLTAALLLVQCSAPPQAPCICVCALAHAVAEILSSIWLLCTA